MTDQHFHDGELRLQDQLGVREKMEIAAQHMMRNFMPDQHRQFFEGLEYIFLGTVDKTGLPHASLLSGAPRFVYSPNPETLIIQTGYRDNQPALQALAVGQAVGVLGLDLSNRRRNRMHGRISELNDDSITVSVVQSYGNCPKYISVREISERDVRIESKITEGAALNIADVDLISAADTFFIASYVSDGSNASYEGVDMSHRGGEPGFITVDSPSQISVPDYKGNNLFNTLGNLLVNPNAALLFIDFETGDHLHINGEATLIEDADDIAEYAGAQRLLRIQIKRIRRQSCATALRWRFIESSPFNPTLDQT
ncbi:MAG: pyridoxamine 5'-phosphate oxidase family protein [Litorimonas sp.]